MLLASPVRAAPVSLRIATLAPDGAAWMKLAHAWQAAIETGTEGRVRIKFYTGGVQGDERDVLRKIKLGQLAGAAITGIGLSAITPEVRALDMAVSYDQMDKLRAALGDRLKRKFQENGFILLGWGDVGPVHLFSQTPVRTLEEMQRLKLWLWADDPISQKLFKGLDLNGVPMGVPDVLPALSTGTINAFLSAPLATVALQWGTHVKYVSSLVLAQASGATVVSKVAWDQIGAADQQLILAESHKLEAALLGSVRADNDKAMARLKAMGIQVVEAPEEFEEDLTLRTLVVAQELGKKMDPEFRRLVRALLREMWGFKEIRVHAR